MSAEAIIRQTIESHLADWDHAYAEKDAYGYLGHCTPDVTGELEQALLFYRQLMPFCEVLESHSTVRKFTVEDKQAVVTIQVDQKLVIKEPVATLPLFNKFVIGCLARLVFVSREVRHLIWVDTPVGWLCKSDNRVSNRLRVRRKPAPI